MDISVEVNEWCSMALRLVWLFSVASVGLSLFFPVSLWRRRRAVVAILRGLSRALQKSGILLYRSARPQLAQELTRARRYQHALTVVTLSFTHNPSTEQQDELTAEHDDSNGFRFDQQTYSFHFVFPFVGVIMRDSIRESDIITYDAINNQYVILLPESSRPYAIQAVQRLLTLISKRVLVSLRVGLAEFPTDGLTIEDLVNRAQTAGAHWSMGVASLESIVQKRP
jgi:hypothetical protein